MTASTGLGSPPRQRNDAGQQPPPPSRTPPAASPTRDVSSKGTKRKRDDGGQRQPGRGRSPVRHQQAHGFQTDITGRAERHTRQTGAQCEELQLAGAREQLEARSVAAQELFATELRRASERVARLEEDIARARAAQEPCAQLSTRVVELEADNAAVRQTYESAQHKARYESTELPSLHDGFARVIESTEEPAPATTVVEDTVSDGGNGAQSLHQHWPVRGGPAEQDGGRPARTLRTDGADEDMWMLACPEEGIDEERCARAANDAEDHGVQRRGETATLAPSDDDEQWMPPCGGQLAEPAVVDRGVIQQEGELCFPPRADKAIERRVVVRGRIYDDVTVLSEGTQAASEDLVMLHGAGRQTPAAPMPRPAAYRPPRSHGAGPLTAHVTRRLADQVDVIAREWQGLMAGPRHSAGSKRTQHVVSLTSRRACIGAVLGGLVLSALRPPGQPWRTSQGVVRVYPLQSRHMLGNTLPRHVAEEYEDVPRTTSATCKPCLACMLAGTSAMCLHPPGAGEMWRRGDLLEERHVAAAGDRDFEPNPPDSGKSDWNVIGEALERKVVTRANARLVLDHTLGVLRGVFGDEACEEYAGYVKSGAACSPLGMTPRSSFCRDTGACALLEDAVGAWARSDAHGPGDKAQVAQQPTVLKTSTPPRGALSGRPRRAHGAQQLAARSPSPHTARYLHVHIVHRLADQVDAIAPQWQALMARPRQKPLAVERAHIRRACIDGVLSGLVLSALRPPGQPWRSRSGELGVHPLRNQRKFSEVLPRHVAEAYRGEPRAASATCKPCLACMLAESAMCLHPPGAGEMWRRGDLLAERHVAAAGDRDFEPYPSQSGKSDWLLLANALERKIVTRANARLVLDHTLGVLRGVFGDEACAKYAQDVKAGIHSSHVSATCQRMRVWELLERAVDAWVAR